MSIYDDNASEMTLQGYFVLPSRNKIPHRFVRGVGLVRLSGWTTMSTPLPTPQPDADIAIRLGGGVVAFDIDDDGAVVPILESYQRHPLPSADNVERRISIASTSISPMRTFMTVTNSSCRCCTPAGRRRCRRAPIRAEERTDT